MSSRRRRPLIIIFFIALIIVAIGFAIAITVSVLNENERLLLQGWSGKILLIFLALAAVFTFLTAILANIAQITGVTLKDWVGESTSQTSDAPVPPADCVARPLIPPLPPPHFTGREEVIAEIEAALQAGEDTAITALAGMGGIGKTALAKKLAEALRETFPGGVLWTELGRHPPELPVVLGRWARFCGRLVEDMSGVTGLIVLVRGLLDARGRLPVIPQNECRARMVCFFQRKMHGGRSQMPRKGIVPVCYPPIKRAKINPSRKSNNRIQLNMSMSCSLSSMLCRCIANIAPLAGNAKRSAAWNGTTTFPLDHYGSPPVRPPDSRGAIAL